MATPDAYTRMAYRRMSARNPDLSVMSYDQAMARPQWRQAIECRARALRASRLLNPSYTPSNHQPT